MPLQIIREDITKMKVDAIVNTTNQHMIGLSGVDLAVHKSAGAELDEYCRKIIPIEMGKAVITDGFALPCKKIIHICGPILLRGDLIEQKKLEACYLACLDAAVENGIESIAFPLISSGNNGYPKDRVLHVAVSIITDFLLEHELEVYICVFDRKSYELSKKLVRNVKSYIGSNLEKADFEAYGPVYSEKIRNIGRKAPKTQPPLLTPDSDDGLCEPLFECVAKECSVTPSADISLEDMINHMDKSFADTLFALIDKKGITDVECYKKANVSRKTFSKIKCDPKYRPSKETAIAFAIALELNLEQTNAFLRTAGIVLSHSYTFDVIIEYFIINGKYDIMEINETLFDFDQICLGC